MRLHMLGVNGPFPESLGANSGYLLEAGDALLQFDFGAGVLARLTAVMPPESLSAVFLSHWHFDHTSDLLPLLYRLQALGRKLPVYAPVDESSPIRNLIRASGIFELTDVAPGDTIRVGEAGITVGPARHPVPAVGFRVEQGGVRFGYTGDTNTLPELAAFYQGCRLLLADGLFPEADWTEAKPHLSAVLAAELAVEANAEKLLLTHLNPMYSPSLLLREARSRFSGASLAEAGRMTEL